MTLYYPSGLYGPVCDVSTEIADAPIQYEVTRLEPKIDIGIENRGDTDIPINPLNRIKICSTIRVGTLLSGASPAGYGPVCDNAGDGGDGGGGGASSFELCPDDTVPEVLKYIDKPKFFQQGDRSRDPLRQQQTNVNYDIELPGLKCEIAELELQQDDGTTKIIKYFKDCIPVVGDFSGWTAPDLGITLPSGKRKYIYYNNLVCGATNYYSAPGVYFCDIPQGITSVNFVIFGAGGGSGGGDASLGPSGSGNNSGGSGSFAFLTAELNPSIPNRAKIVVGGGGPAGRTWVNEPIPTLPGYNRGGYGGHSGPTGVSGCGGGGGGATDIYLNERLIASIAGGGGGGGNGCNYFQATTGKPWGNWNNKSYNGNLSTTQDGLIRSRASGLMQYSVFDPPIKHSLWGPWFNQYVVFFNSGEDNYEETELENRVNLNFDTAGTYTFELMGDNRLSIYIAPWTDPGETYYVQDILHNGSFPMVIVDPIIQLTTPPPTISNPGYPTWILVGATGIFTEPTPDVATYNITSPGRYVLRFILFNATRQGKDWLKNPAGMAIRITKPDGSVFWTTRYGFGANGDNMLGTLASGDGGGGGGGGGNSGFAGLVAANTGLTGGSCGAADSTGQGGSAGWSYIIDHPGVTVNFFDQAPGGFHSGWQTPTEDPSTRKGYGGLGGGRPEFFKIRYNGIDYDLVSSAGAFKEVTIPGMGTGVWTDFMSGKTFQYHYMWGLTKDGGPTTVPASIGDMRDRIMLGSYQHAINCPAATRSSLYAARSLELAFKWTPIKTSANNWDTKIRLVGKPGWGLGTGFADGDVLPGVMPPSRSQGTQPWWDIITDNTSSWHVLGFLDPTDNKFKLSTTGQTFSFSIIVGQTSQRDKFQSQPGAAGFARVQYLTVDTVYEAEE
jgi:hypothetical protein